MEYFYDFTIVFFLVLFLITLVISYFEIKKMLKKNNDKFEYIIEDISTSISELKTKEDDAIVQRNSLENSLNNMFFKQNELIDSVTILHNEVTEISDKIEDIENRLGSDLDYYADSVLVKLTGLTDLKDLQLYLNQKRTIIVNEAKRLLQIGINNITPEIVESSWEDMRRQLYQFGINVSNEFRAYIENSVHLREDKLKKYKSTLLNAIEHGNGSKDKIFIEEIKEYIKKQLEFTFKDYPTFRMNFSKSEKNNYTIEYFKSLISENKIDTVFNELNIFVRLKNNNELINRLTIINAQYNEYKENLEMNIRTDISLGQINRNLISFIDTVFLI